MSKTFQILKQQGIKSALEYVADKKAHKGGIYRRVQNYMMFVSLASPRRGEMYDFLKKYHIATTDSDFLTYFINEYDKIKEWVGSSSFHETYANHPYPPLLDPKTLDYTHISPQIAWELNIPLPPYYKFMYFGSHASGNRGLNHCVLTCGGMDYVRAPTNVKTIYQEYWNQILTHRTFAPCYFGYVSVREYLDNEEGKKLYALIPSTKALNLVRDPISVIKSGINYRRKRLKEAQEENLNLMLEPDFICENLVGYNGFDVSVQQSTFGNEDAPCLDVVQGMLQYIFTDFHDTALRKSLINLKDDSITCIDMSEIVGEKAFETMNALANTFDFPPPSASDKEKLAMSVSHYEGFLPLVFKIQTPSGMIKLHLMDNVYCIDKRIYARVPVDEVYLDQHQNALGNFLDITSFIFQQESFLGRIILCVEKEDFEILKNHTTLCVEIREYFLRFIPRLEQQRKLEVSKQVKESDILAYFTQHTQIALKAKAVFDKHLSFLRSVRPDIIESWQYYQAFLKICEEMSDENKKEQTHTKEQ